MASNRHDVFEEDEASGASVSWAFQKELPTASLPISITSPVVVPVLTGTFTPLSSAVTIDVDVGHVFEESLGANARWLLYTGPTGEGQLTPTVATGAGAPTQPIVSGASVYTLGSIGSLTGSMHAMKLLTGLTPGMPLRFEVSVAVVGGAERLSGITNGPFAIDFATTLSNYPDSSYWGAIRLATTGTVQLIKAKHVDRYEDDLISTPISPTGATAGYGRVAMTPDGTKCVMTTESTTTNNVAVITTGNNTGAASAIQGTYTVPGTSPGPSAVVIDPTGTYAWIGIVNLGNVVRMTVATGAMGSAISVGGNGDAGSTWGRGGLIMAPNGNYVYSVNNSAKTVSQINTSTQAVTATCSFGTAVKVGCISPDSSTLYVVSNTELYQVTTSTMTIANTVAVPSGLTSPFACDIFPDGRTMLLVQNLSSGGAEVQEINLPALTQAAYWSNSLNGSTEAVAYDVRITPNGAIYIPDDTGSGVNLWCGGQVLFDSSQPYWPGELRIRLQPVSAGS